MRELRLIMKFGGTSVADGDRIESVSKIVQKESAKNEIVVVTSAMDSTTDYLIELAERANSLRSGWANVFSNTTHHTLFKTITNPITLFNTNPLIIYLNFHNLIII